MRLSPPQSDCNGLFSLHRIICNAGLGVDCACFAGILCANTVYDKTNVELEALSTLLGNVLNALILFSSSGSLRSEEDRFCDVSMLYFVVYVADGVAVVKRFMLENLYHEQIASRWF